MGNTTETKRRGRPPKPAGEVKRNQVNIAFADSTYQAIKEAAERNGRSVSSEVDYRLGLSLALERDAGDPDTRRLLDFTRLASVSIRDSMGPWTKDVDAASALIGALEAFVRYVSPPLPETGDYEKFDAEMVQLIEELQGYPDFNIHSDPMKNPQSAELARRLLLHMVGLGSTEMLERKRRYYGRQQLGDLIEKLAGGLRPDEQEEKARKRA